ncbi:hypothetical protein T492DRAFT_887012 [Pavlovales sp. CCMP2436]|nr:hypothetical protein T492DRAFT_887012 [Pavlovales sp. CCMP2436]
MHGSHSAQWAAALANGRVSAAEWYAELGAVLAALAKEAERARAELQDEHADDDADWTARGREDIMLSTQA